jgi:hypothetical protein
LKLRSQFGRFLLCQPKRRAAVETTGFRHHFKNNGVPAPDNLGGLSPFHAADFYRQFNPRQAASVGGLFHSCVGTNQSQSEYRQKRRRWNREGRATLAGSGFKVAF